MSNPSSELPLINPITLYTIAEFDFIVRAAATSFEAAKYGLKRLVRTGHPDRQTRII
jgi:hypothetical protein